MQLKELIRQLREGESIEFEKLDDSVGVAIQVMANHHGPGETPNTFRRLTTQQVTASNSDLVRDAIEDMLREVRK
jgi:hypothetical protein